MSYLEIQELVKSKSKIRPTGAGSKPALSGWGNLSLVNLSGILEYNPQEYTFTALAGTTLKKVEQTLSEHGQYLPFDPPLVEAGATLGGTVAAGLSGPGRFRYGGVRDFLLGIKFINGEGKVITGGGKVVKNAAGFDFPKLLVGSLGQLGVLVELTFKVFPKPETYKTLKLNYPTLEAANRAMQQLAMSGAELSCLDFLPPYTLLLRVGGLAKAIDKRLENLQHLGQAGDIIHDDQALWQEAREFSYCKDTLLKIALNPGQLLDLERALAPFNVTRRYSVGGNVLYMSWSESQERLEPILDSLGLSALVIKGPFKKVILGQQPNPLFIKRLSSVLDPQGKFSLEIPSA
jgi:glycolate oxidase FAD binding subunit